MFDSYHYVYIDSTRAVNRATNPSFIAYHKKCYAIPKELISDIQVFISNLNKMTPHDAEFTLERFYK